MIHPHNPSNIIIEIPEGTTIRSTAPEGDRVARTTYKVDVFEIQAGFLPADPWDASHGVGRVAEFLFTGGSGYWCWVAVEDVVIVQGHHRLLAFAELNGPLITRSVLEQSMTEMSL